MSQSGLALIDAKTAAEVVCRAALGDEAPGLVERRPGPGKFLDLLIEQGHLLDAIRFLAHALPQAEAVWWACRCVTEIAGPESAGGQGQAALEAAARPGCSTRPSENRRACWAAAEAAGSATPAGCAAMAAFWSGGSLAPPDLPAVPPGEDLTGAHGRRRRDARGGHRRNPRRRAEKYATLPCRDRPREIADGQRPLADRLAATVPPRRPAPSRRLKR